MPADGTGHAGPQLGRPQVHVQVELGPQPQQQAALQHPGRHVRAANRAEQDRIGLAQLVEHGVRQHLAGGQEVLGAKRVAAPLNDEPVVDGDRVHTVPGHLGDLGPHPVAGQVRDDVRPRAARRGCM